MQTLAALKDGQLTSTIRLQLAENLTEFPKEIFDLADTLEVLDLSNNGLSSLPKDFGRLTRLKILFLSNNQFETLPKVLADCPKLEMIGFKANKIHTVDEDVLPLQTRWLILTDNKIESLPDSMGQLHRLQKLALAGNRLASLPESMVNCKNLELVRLSANLLTHLPNWLLQLPKLSWLAFAGNRLDKHENSQLASKEPLMSDGMLTVKMTDIDLGEQLGEGASGVIYKGKWNRQPTRLLGTPEMIAVKLFKGEITSDGYPVDELTCCLQAGEHPNLIKVISQVNEQEHLGLVMALIPPSFVNLGLPPSLLTCTRDTFGAGTQFSVSQIAKILLQMAQTMTHLHRQAVSHGDLYAHNIMINSDAEMLFGDFGASSDLSDLPQLQREAMQAIEVRAFGCLVDDLLSVNAKHLSDAAEASGMQALLAVLMQMRDSCLQDKLSLRPRFFEISDALQSAVLQRESEACA